MALLLNEYPYSDYQKINLDWVLDLGNKLKADAESGAFDGERGHGIFGITTIYSENNQYYAINPGGVTAGDFILGYGPAVGTNILYIMKVTSVTGNYVNGTSITRITGPQGSQGQQGEPGEGGLSEAMKQAFLQLARKVAYIDGNGQTYYNALYNAFYGGAPVVVLDSITAVFNQGSAIVHDTDTLDSLKQYLTVTATYSDSSTATVPSADYTLSGTLTAGASTITVSYGGKTTTFNVTVTATPQYVTSGLIGQWDGINNTRSGHNSSATAWEDLVGTNNFTTLIGYTWDNDGILFSGSTSQRANTENTFESLAETTIEMVVAPSSTTTQVLASFDSASFDTSKRIVLYSDNTIGFVGQTGTTYRNSEQSLTDIRTIAVTYNGNVVSTARINDNVLSLSTTTHSLRGAPGYIALAINPESAATRYPYSGKIMALRVYNRQLSASELTQNHAIDVSRFGLGV